MPGLLGTTNDDDALNIKEKWAWIIANIAGFILIIFTDHEVKTNIFNIVDPWLLYLWLINIFFLIWAGGRARLSRVSYTLVSPNFHCSLLDQKPETIDFLPVVEESVGGGILYDTYLVSVKGISVPQLSFKTTLIISPENCVETTNWGLIYKTRLRQYVGSDHKSLPPHLTEGLSRMGKKNVKFTFGGTKILFADTHDRDVAVFEPKGIYVNEDGDVLEEVPDKGHYKRYNWGLGDKYIKTHNLSDEESLNRTIHEKRHWSEVKSDEYLEITGKPYSPDNIDYGDDS